QAPSSINVGPLPPATALPSLDESWPAPGQVGAPGVLPNKPDGGVSESPPPTLPLERVPPREPIALPKRSSMPADQSGSSRSGILFYVDNTKCQRNQFVYLDGKRLGDVLAATRSGFQTTPGPHDLCVLDDAKKECGAPGTLRRSYLHEGWTISLRCE